MKTDKQLWYSVVGFNKEITGDFRKSDRTSSGPIFWDIWEERHKGIPGGK